jgi:hypothetical protein
LGKGNGIITLIDVKNFYMDNFTLSNNLYYYAPILLIESGATHLNLTNSRIINNICDEVNGIIANMSLMFLF